MHIPKEQLQKILLDSGFIEKEELDAVFEESARTEKTVANIIIGRNLIPEDLFLETLQPYFGVPIENLTGRVINHDVLLRIPEQIAKLRGVILLDVDETSGIAYVAMRDPFDFATRNYLSRLLGLYVRPALMGESSFTAAVKQYAKSFSEDFSSEITQHAKRVEEEAGEGGLEKQAESASVTTLVDRVLEHAVTLNASDIHFEPLSDALLIRFRIDGVMREIISLPASVSPTLVARVKVLADLAIDEHRKPQDGRIRFTSASGVNVDLRVNILPVFHGEKAEMRLLKSASRPLTLHDLGYSAHDEEIINQEISKSHGIVLVTGPTGHGKTTSLYAILHILNKPEVNITTIEDPIEYEFKRVNQTQVDGKSGVTFATGLRALLRQNPDIIMIGEIRDNETLDIAIKAALTGHRVLSSLHTNDSTSAPGRMLDMGAEPFLLASTLNAVIAQRLVRRNCRLCVESYTADAALSERVTAEMHQRGETKFSIPKTLFRGRGCGTCGGTGYTGVIGIYEVMTISDGIRELVTKGRPAHELRALSIAEGMVTMLEDGLQKVEFGITSLDEVLRVIRQ